MLKDRAAAAGMSLSDYLLDEFRALAETPSPSEWVARVRADELFEFEESSADIIRRDRDAR